MKIFIGTQDICGLLPVYKRGFEELGHEVKTGVYSINPFFKGHHFNYNLSAPKYFRFSEHSFLKGMNPLIYYIEKFFFLRKRKSQISSIIESNDLFIFLWGMDTLKKDYRDLEIIKNQGKKIISLFVGSDIRHESAMKEEFKINLELISGNSGFYKVDINRPLECLRQHEMYSNVIYSVPDQSSLAIRPYNHFQIPINLSEFEFKNWKRRIPRILHAPSRKDIKGTGIILNAIKILEAEGLKFKFDCIQNVSNKDLKKLLFESDILIDQLNAHGPGVLGIEAMASGCAVATRYLQTSPKVFTPPIVPIDENNIVDSIRKLVSNIMFRTNLIIEAREYVVKNNSYLKISKDILIDLRNERKINFHYQPNFFVRDFENYSKLRIRKKNKNLTIQVLKKEGIIDSAVVNRLKSIGMV